MKRRYTLYYERNDNTPTFTVPEYINKLLIQAYPECPAEPDDPERQFDQAYCDSFCEQKEQCQAVQELIQFLYPAHIVCMCRDNSHREHCFFGEKGKKTLRKIEDFLRKNMLATKWVAQILGIK